MEQFLAQALAPFGAVVLLLIARPFVIAFRRWFPNGWIKDSLLSPIGEEAPHARAARQEARSLAIRRLGYQLGKKASRIFGRRHRSLVGRR